jgi:hypothetical protein
MQREEQLFGFSLMLDEGDIFFIGPELATVSGVRNLQQALTLRILTPFGSDRFNTTYGFDAEQAFAHPGGLRMTKELIRLNLVRTLGTDPRVRDITDVLFTDDPAYRARHTELSDDDIRDLRHSRLWLVEVTLELIDGKVQTLSASIGA